jgi:hypothetical protein
MPKPLLTDDIIKDYEEDQEEFDRKLKQEMDDDTKLIKKYDQLERKLEKSSVNKSRRIENAKRSERDKSINKWIFILILMLAFLAFAIFKL